MLGPSLSTRLLYLAETVSVDEVVRLSNGFVTAVLPKEGLENAVIHKLETQLEGLSYESILASKSLVKSPEARKVLHDINSREMKVLAEKVKSDDHREALIRFQERRKNKKASSSKL